MQWLKSGRTYYNVRKMHQDVLNLSQLTSRPMTLADTALGRHQQVIKRQVSNVVIKMLQEEREDLRKKLEKMDEMEEEDH